MGYIYTVDGKLCCDICGRSPARKHKCPYDYCQPLAICKECWEKTEIKKIMSKEAHSNCKINREEYERNNRQKKELYDAGKFVRCSATTRDDITSKFNIEVTFRNGDFAGCLYKKALMEKETYNSIPLLVNATIEDYEKNGLVLLLKDVDKPN